MKYIKYTVTKTDGQKIELARSYKNNQRVPKCPCTWRIKTLGASMVESVYCSQKEKAKIYRRGDHAQYEELIDVIEKLTEGVPRD